jgi:hypothetical protein
LFPKFLRCFPRLGIFPQHNKARSAVVLSRAVATCFGGCQCPMNACCLRIPESSPILAVFCGSGRPVSGGTCSFFWSRIFLFAGQMRVVPQFWLLYPNSGKFSERFSSKSQRKVSLLGFPAQKSCPSWIGRRSAQSARFVPPESCRWFPEFRPDWPVRFFADLLNLADLAEFTHLSLPVSRNSRRSCRIRGFTLLKVAGFTRFTASHGFLRITDLRVSRI